MTVVDTLVVGTLAIGLILGLMRGLLSQVTGLIGLIGGLFLAGRYYMPLRKNAMDPFLDSGWNTEIAFISIVVFVVLVAAVVGWVIGKMVEKLDLGAYDRLMGAAFGVVKAGLICGGILLAIVTFAPDGGTLERHIGTSKAGPLLWDAMNRVARVLPGEIRGDFEGYLGKHQLPPRPDAEPAETPATSREPE